MQDFLQAFQHQFTQSNLTKLPSKTKTAEQSVQEAKFSRTKEVLTQRLHLFHHKRQPMNTQAKQKTPRIPRLSTKFIRERTTQEKSFTTERTPAAKSRLKFLPAQFSFAFMHTKTCLQTQNLRNSA